MASTVTPALLRPASATVPTPAALRLERRWLVPEDQLYDQCMLLRLEVGRDKETNQLSLSAVVSGQSIIPATLRGVDPDWVLPPLSGVLLPSRVGRSVMLGTCCTPGCASFSLQVRRDGGIVLWEPDPQPLDQTLTARLEFQLLEYLDAVDAATTDAQLHERGRRLARAVEQALTAYADKFDQPHEVTLPMAWQTGEGAVNLRHGRRLYAVALQDLPSNDDEAVQALTRMALDPRTLPAPQD